VVSFTHQLLTPGEITYGTHSIGGCVDPRAGLDDVEKRKIIENTGTRTPTPIVVQPVASSYTDYSIPTPRIIRGHNIIIKIEYK
jgi:L-aminopeptidase/D-esterase-like protein